VRQADSNPHRILKTYRGYQG